MTRVAAPRIFLGAWALVLVLNAFGGCWFYSDARGEYSFSEWLSAASYAAAAILLLRSGHRAAAAFCGWLLLEEINYGQVFLAASPTNYYFDEEQVSLHTSFLRSVSLGPMDLADAAAIVLILAITVGVPIVLSRRVKAPVWVLALPLALTVVVCAGKLLGFLVPWQCGNDAFEEITETLQATTTVYFALLLRFSERTNGWSSTVPGKSRA